MSDHRQGSCNRCGELTKYIINSNDKYIDIRFFTCRNAACISDVMKGSAIINKVETNSLRMEHT